MISLFLLVILLTGVSIFIYKKNSDLNQGNKNPTNRELSMNTGCISEKKISEVEGVSMEPLLKDGDIVKNFVGYHECNELRRNDLIIYDYPGSQIPLIKKIVGLPGDEFDLKKAENENKWLILINGNILTNSSGKKYFISKERYEILKLYEEDYDKIPEDAYMILGNVIHGSEDSSKFGFVSGEDIIGVAQKIKR